MFYILHSIPHPMKKYLLPVLAGISTICFAQEKMSPDDYKRAVSFMWENINNKKAFQLNVAVEWFPDSTGYWYTMNAPAGKEYTKVTFKPLKKAPLFDHWQLASKLAPILKDK